jgi:hypothetical protein
MAINSVTINPPAPGASITITATAPFQAAALVVVAKPATLSSASFQVNDEQPTAVSSITISAQDANTITYLVQFTLTTGMCPNNNTSYNLSVTAIDSTGASLAGLTTFVRNGVT